MKTHFPFIHGIAKKPSAETLHKIWLDTLKKEVGNGSEINIEKDGISTSIIYWDDIFHSHPLLIDRSDDTYVMDITDLDAVVMEDLKSLDAAWLQNITEEESKLIKGIAKKYENTIEENQYDNPDCPQETLGYDHSVLQSENNTKIPLQWFFKKLMMRQFLKEVHHYLFNEVLTPRANTKYRVMNEIRKRFVSSMQPVNTDRHIHMTHSMGTVISYNCLRSISDCPAAEAFITIGSPQGLEEAKDQIKPCGADKTDFPAKVKGEWYNFHNTLDVVSLWDCSIDNDYLDYRKKIIKDILVRNSGTWRHSINNYLLRKELREV